MKKIYFFVLLLILIFVSYLNINENSRLKEPVVPLKENLKSIKQETEKIEEELPPNLFPDVYDLSKLTLDKKLPLPAFKDLTDTLTTDSSTISIKVEVKNISGVDLFLFKNNRKTDMFYQVREGEYQFNNVILKEGENIIETFYRKGSRRSISVYTIIQLIKRE